MPERVAAPRACASALCDAPLGRGLGRHSLCRTSLDSLRGELDGLDLARGLGNGEPAFAQAVEVKGDGLADLRFGLGRAV